MPNGAICSSTSSMMSSPGPQGPMPTGPDGQADPRSYMMMSTASNIPVLYFILMPYSLMNSDSIIQNHFTSYAYEVSVLLKS